MTSFTDLRREAITVKMLGVGEPGAGKTGSLAALINTGKYKFRVVDLDGHFIQSVAPYIKPEFDHLVEVFRYEDQMRLFGPNSANATTVGKPMQFIKVMNLLTNWKYTDPQGREIDLGKPNEWGNDTVLVLDSLSALNRAAMNHTIFVEGRVESGPRRRDWGKAANIEEAIVEMLTSGFWNCHTITFAHTRLVGPDEPEDEGGKGGGDVTAAKREITMSRNEHIEWRECPAAVGKSMSRSIAQHWPILVVYETEIKQMKVKRIMHFEPSKTMLTKVPALNVPQSLPSETGLVWLFDAITGAGNPKAVATT